MDMAAHVAAQLSSDLVTAWNTHDVDQIMEFYSPDFEGEDVAQPAVQRGKDGIRHTIQRYFQAFPDLQFEDRETIIQGNRTALIWTARGTHQGTLMNIPATGRSIEINGASFLTIEDSKITRTTFLWDVAGLLRAIGLLPDL